MAGQPDEGLFTDYTDFGGVRRSLACGIFLVRSQRELVVLLKALGLGSPARNAAARGMIHRNGNGLSYGSALNRYS